MTKKNLASNPILNAVMDSIPRWDKAEDADSPDFVDIWTQWITEYELGFDFTEDDRTEALHYLANKELATAMQTVVDNNEVNRKHIS